MTVYDLRKEAGFGEVGIFPVLLEIIGFHSWK